MECVRTILVASNHSEYACHAESRAKMLGRELVRHAAECPHGNTDHAESKPAAIVERANEIDVDLIVVAARQNGFLGGLVTRFRNEELIRLSDRPVLLVHREPVSPYRKVLVAVDFSEESQQAARMALAIAPGALFSFLHVYRVPEEEMMIAHGVHTDAVHPCRIRTRETARLRLNRFIDELGKRRQLISREVEHGVPAPVIHQYAKKINADLIVVGKHGKSRFVELFLGSVTQRLIDYGDCDLLVTTSLRDEQCPMPPAA